MRHGISKPSNRNHKKNPLWFATKFYACKPPEGATVVRIVQAFDEETENRNRVAYAVLDDVLKTWPSNFKTRYLITAGGFLSFEWPKRVTPADPGQPTQNEIQFLQKAAVDACTKFLTPTLRKRLTKVTDYISLGADSKSNDGERSVELVFLFDLRSRQRWMTGKSYPTEKQKGRLVRINDLSSHLLTAGRNKILLLGCHDLNMFSNRARKNCSKYGWRKKQIDRMQEITRRFAPIVALQHPHYTHSPHSWGTAWGGLKELLPNVTFAGAGRWCRYHKKPPRPLQTCLRATAQGAVATAVVRRTK